MAESGRLIDLLRMWFNDTSALNKSERDETFSALRDPLNPIYKESDWAYTAVEFLVAHARDNAYLDDSLSRTLNGIALNAEPAASTEARAFLLVYYRDFSQLEPLSSVLLDADNLGFSDALAAFASLPDSDMVRDKTRQILSQDAIDENTREALTAAFSLR